MAQPGVYLFRPSRGQGTVRQIVEAAGGPDTPGVLVTVRRRQGGALVIIVDGVRFASVTAGSPADVHLQRDDMVMLTAPKVAADRPDAHGDAGPASRPAEAYRSWSEKYAAMVIFKAGRPINLDAVKGAYRREVQSIYPTTGLARQ